MPTLTFPYSQKLLSLKVLSICYHIESCHEIDRSFPLVHRFTLILKDTHGIIDDLTGEALMDMTDALFEAGCDDASPGISCGIISVPFDREADSLREAVVSAIQQIHQAGYKVERVEPDEQRLFEDINSLLASGTQLTI